MKKRAAILLAAALTASLLTGCGGSGKTGGAGGSTGSGKGEVTWTWGTLRGLYGDAEVTFNEDGGRDTVLLKYPGGAVYRQIEYDYNMGIAGGGEGAEGGENYLSGKQVYPVKKLTKDGGGNLLYTYGYDWWQCSDSVSQWGAGIASDITPILEAGEQIEAGKTPKEEEGEQRFYSSFEYGYDEVKEESSSSVSYQEMAHTVLSGQYMDVYHYGNGYWLTQRVDGNPVKTWFYAPDGRLEEDLTITWLYEKDKPVSLQLGQYSMDTYLAEVSDDGLTVTYTLDESHAAENDEGETKDLSQIYSFVLTRLENGSPAQFSYNSTVDYLNTDEPEVTEYKIVWTYENDVPAAAQYSTSETGKQSREFGITFNEAGMLATEDHLELSIGGGDIGAKAYTYYDSGMLETVTGYGDFTTEDPSQIEYVDKYSEEGVLIGRTVYEDGEAAREISYTEEAE